MTATELSDYCDKFKQEHGLMLLLDVLDEMEVAYFTVQ